MSLNSIIKNPIQKNNDLNDLNEEDEDEDYNFTIFPDISSLHKSTERRIYPMANSYTECLLYKMKAFASTPGCNKKPGNTLTHLIMTGDHGGGFVLPNTKKANDAFLNAYAEDLNHNRILYIIEQRTPIFHFFVDFDIKRKTPYDDESVLGLINDLIYCLKKFYPETTAINRFDCVVLACIENGKSGLHPIFPNLNVNVGQAMMIRNFYVSYLTTKYGNMSGVQNSWEDIVDMAVFKGSGLRMVRSHKSGTCSACNGNSKKNYDLCEVCAYFGKVDKNRSYNPLFYLHDGKIHDEYTQALKGDLNQFITQNGIKRRCIELCSIRSFVSEPSSDFMPSGEVQNNSSYVYSDEKKGVLSKPQVYKTIETEHGTYKVLEEDYASISRKRNKVFLNPNSEEILRLQQYISSDAFHAQYRELTIHNVFSNENKTYYQVNVRGNGNEKFCLNLKKGCHNSNSIYFYITDLGIYQKCYCRCIKFENRINGLCKDFQTFIVPLPNDLKRLLFPKSISKVGNLHNMRAITMKSEKDKTLFSMAATIASLEDSRNEYLDYRAKNLRKRKYPEKSSNDDKNENMKPVKKRKNTKFTKAELCEFLTKLKGRAHTFNKQTGMIEM